MKKLFFITVCFIGLCACNHRENSSDIFRDFDSECAINDSTNNAWDIIVEYQWHGHDYIKFRCANSPTSGVVHDPDCKHPNCVRNRNN